MSCETKLKNLIADNFLGYFKAHVYHWNVTGINFPQFHELFSEVYEYLYENHDILNEQLRQMDVMSPTSLKEYISESNFTADNKAKTVEDMVADLAKMLEELIVFSQILYEEAGNESHGALETFIGDYQVGLSKLHWKVKSCL